MEKIKNASFGRFFDKLAIEEDEPGLTHTQLMLNNYDLKPVESARRQWGAWNFVGFWIGKTFKFKEVSVEKTQANNPHQPIPSTSALG